MVDDHDPGHTQGEDTPGEEIQGAPPVETGAEVQARRRAEHITINRFLYRRTQQMVHMLVQGRDLQALIENLLDRLPRQFSLSATELWLYDPEGTLDGLISGRQRYGQSLQLLDAIFSIQELYDTEPAPEIIGATDARMFDILKEARGVDSAIILPITDAGRLVGSLHLGLTEDSMTIGPAEEELLSHIAVVISSCLRSAVQQEQMGQLTIIDPLTLISNARGFERDLAREIAQSQRAAKPLTLLLMEIDDFHELYTHYGERRGNFVVRKVAQRLTSDLRQTDYMARLAQPKFAVLLPATGEVLAAEVAERARLDVEDFPIDDGRGAILQVCLSIGMVTWEPGQYPAVDMARLARQMETVANTGLENAKSRGGNCVGHARLSTMMV